MFKKALFALAIGSSFIFISPSLAHAATLYYNNHAGDREWSNLANWWQNSGFTVQASSLPGSSDDVFIKAEVDSNANDPASVHSADFSNGALWDNDCSGLTLNVSNGATFHDSSYISCGTIGGNATFNDSSVNYGTVTGNAVFSNIDANQGSVGGSAKYTSVTGGIITIGSGWFGSAGSNVGNDNIVITSWIFNGSSSNGNTVPGNATFNDSSTNDGTVTGNATFNDLSQNRGSVGGTATYNTTLYYNNQDGDGEWANIDNWWQDSGFSVQAQALPGATNSVYIQAEVDTNANDPASVRSADFSNGAIWDNGYNGLTLNASNGVIFHDSSFVNSGTIGGNTVFYDLSYSNGTIAGNAVFNDSSYSNGTVTGNGVFNGSSYNGGTVAATSTFNDTAQNAAIVSHNAIFNDQSSNYGNVVGIAKFTALASGGVATLFDGDQWGGGTAGSNVGVDNVVITSWVFNGNSFNNGTLAGNARFNGPDSGNDGLITGTRTRYYTSNVMTTLDFVSDGPWTVVADGAVVDISGATYNASTTLSAINGGSFVYITLSSAAIDTKTLVLTYDRSLATTSVPSTSDFSVKMDGSTVTVTNVAVSSNKITLTLASVIPPVISILIDYVPGAHPIKDTSNDVAAGFTNQTVTNLLSGASIRVGVDPYYQNLIGTKLFVTNIQGNSVSIIDTVTDHVLATVSLPSVYGATVANNKLYANEIAGTAVAVIDGTTNSLLRTITVGTDPEFSVAVNNKVYVGTDEGITVIDAVSDVATAHISIAGNVSPLRVPFAFGKYVYVVANNNFTNKVTVIDSSTDTVVKTITVGSNPSFITAVGDKLYVTNDSGSTVSVIDSRTNVVTATIPVGLQPELLRAIGTKLYVPNARSDTVSVIDTTVDRVIATIPVGSFPRYMNVAGYYVYVSNIGSGNVSIIDSRTDTVVATTTAGATPAYSSLLNGKLYISNSGTTTISILDPVTNALFNYTGNPPRLVSFTSSSASGFYAPGQTINITANFAQAIASGSTMTVTLNTGATVVLSSVSGTTLSGTYTIGAGDQTPDLSVSSIGSASVSDTTGTTTARTDYSTHPLPSSVGSLVAENPFITRNIGDAKNIAIGSYKTIPVGTNPYQVSAPVTVGGIVYLYVANQGSDSVSVIRAKDNVVVATTTVGSEPYGITVVTVSGVPYVYVANTGSNSVSVINASTNSVVATVSVGVKPYYLDHVGTNVYVTNSLSNTVSVIDGNTNTVATNVGVGNYPRGIKAHGTDLYVANFGDLNYGGGNSVSVIDSTTNTLTKTIPLPAGSVGPRGVTVDGNKAYVANYFSNNVSVIDTATNMVVATVPVGAGPRGMAASGNSVYVENFDNGTVSVIDTGTNSVTATVNVGHSPAGMSVVGTNIYLSRFQDGELSILNTLDNTLRASTTLSLSNVFSRVTGKNSAIVTWATDAGADSLVEYGLASAYTASSTYSSTLGLSHSVSLSDLSPDTVYHYRVVSVDGAGVTATSSDQTFVTDAATSRTSQGGGSVSSSILQALFGKPTAPVANCPLGFFCSPIVPSAVPASVIPASVPAVSYAFKKDLQLSSVSNDVLVLQQYLNNHGDAVSKLGAGSQGHETTKFGPATKAALIKFQKAHGIPATGFFGPKTRAYVTAHQ